MTTCRLLPPVDVAYDNSKILIRRVPGFADLTQRTAEAGTFHWEKELASYRARLAKDELPPLTILKANPVRQGSVKSAKRCKATFDVGLGKEANFVVRGIEGDRITQGPEAHITEATEQLRAHLDDFDGNQPAQCRPSLCYITGEHPREIQVEVTTHCNLRCGYSNNRLLPAKRYTPVEEVFRMLDHIDFAQLKNVDLTGLGESFLHPALTQIVAKIRKRGVRDITFVTNGTVATVERCRNLIEAGLTGISISIDSLDPVRFLFSRVGGKFDIVRNNPFALLAMR